MEFLLFGLTGGFWFVAFIIAFLIFGAVASEYDNFFWGTLTLVSGLAIMQWIFGVPIWATITANPFAILIFAAIYVLVGAIYAGFWRFRNYVLSHEGKIKSDFISWIKSSPNYNSKDDISSLISSDQKFEEFLDSSYYPMAPSKHKNRLANWVLMWPFALLWELSHKPAIWVWNTIYAQLGSLFLEISKNTARSIRNSGKK